MKRDMDLVRTILLRIEETPHQLTLFQDDPALGPSESVRYHLELLKEAGLIQAKFYATGGPLGARASMTWEGHEFLDNIRSDTVWNATKDRVGPAVGTASLAVMVEVAKSVIKGYLNIP